MKVEVAVLGSPSLTVLISLCGRKATLNNIPNTFETATWPGPGSTLRGHIPRNEISTERPYRPSHINVSIQQRLLEDYETESNYAVTLTSNTKWRGKKRERERRERRRKKEREKRKRERKEEREKKKKREKKREKKVFVFLFFLMAVCNTMVLCPL